MKLIYATGNKGKLYSLQKSFEGSSITIEGRGLGLLEVQSHDLQEIATDKARKAYDIVQAPVVTQDSGFYLHSQKGFPGSLTSLALDTLGVAGILKLMEGVKNRSCYFDACLVYKNGDEERVFQGAVHGNLATEERGSHAAYQWSPLWTVFIPEGQDRTLGEMSEEDFRSWLSGLPDKSRVSRSFAKWAREHLEE